MLCQPRAAVLSDNTVLERAASSWMGGPGNAWLAGQVSVPGGDGLCVGVHKQLQAPHAGPHRLIYPGWTTWSQPLTTHFLVLRLCVIIPFELCVPKGLAAAWCDTPNLSPEVRLAADRRCWWAAVRSKGEGNGARRTACISYDRYLRISRNSSCEGLHSACEPG